MRTRKYIEEKLPVQGAVTSMKKKRCCLIVLFLVICMIGAYVRSILNKPPVILLWTTFWGHDHYYFGYGVEPFERHCNCTCELVTDKKKFSDSSVIIIHPSDRIEQFPKQRLPWQRVVFFTLEPPHIIPSMKAYTSFFNWTMTYRRDSDIFMPYGKLKRKEGTQTEDYCKNYAIGKTGLVVMVNSNCNPPSKRQNYVKHLSQFIEVDIYGVCGHDGKRCDGDCDVTRNYKFYLALENSLCKDYITEKVWLNAFARGLVPVVLGGADYTDILPDHSFIDIADFNSPKELAEYLERIADNDSLYSQYFEWRETFDIIPDWIYTFCDLCYKIHTDDLHPKVYPDVDRWWRNGNCLTPEEKYRKLAKYF